MMKTRNEDGLENEMRGNPGNKNESQTEIEMHGINFRLVLVHNLQLPTYERFN